METVAEVLPSKAPECEVTPPHLFVPADSAPSRVVDPPQGLEEEAQPTDLVSLVELVRSRD